MRTVSIYSNCSHDVSCSLSISLQYNVNTVPTFLFINTDGIVLDRIDGGEDVALVTQYYSKLVNATSTTSSSASTQETSEQQDESTTQQSAPEETLNKRLQSLITSSPIVLFLKGTPNTPKCGFSRQAIEMLSDANVSFGYFNILEDDTVRQGLKVYSDWPTYPQLYVRGELVGGLDILKEMAEEDGGLVEQLELNDYVIKSGSGNAFVSAAANNKEQQEGEKKEEVVSMDDKLKQLINRHRIMLFMKGIPSSPKCGFSRQIVDILDSYSLSYDAFNILEDEEVRQGLKVYSDWPTYPQLYVDGDLVGGLDIVEEMVESGDLEELLKGTN